MLNWYAVQRIADGEIVSYSTDDAQGHGILPAGLKYVGPYLSLAAAQDVLQPTVPTASTVTLMNLTAKPSAAWTIADIADWLKAKG